MMADIGFNCVNIDFIVKIIVQIKEQEEFKLQDEIADDDIALKSRLKSSRKFEASKVKTRPNRCFLQSFASRALQPSS